MILPYLDIDNSEIFNAARTVAYLRNLYGARLSGSWELSTDAPCNRLLYGINGIGYPWTFVDPATDHAATGFPPWVNSLFPESEEFLGALITDIVGLSSTASRALTDAPVGGRLGNQRREPRTIQVKGYLVGSPCGIAYGARWFNDYLRSQPCVSCQTHRLGFFKACPGDSTRWAAPSWDGYWQAYDAGIGVGLTTKPVHARDLTTGTIADAGCDLVEFEVTLVAGNPWLYKPASLSYSPDPGTGLIEFVMDPPPLGIDGLVMIWIDAAFGSISQNGATVFSFAGAPTPNVVLYDSAARTFTVDTFMDDILPPDGAKYITSLSAGEPIPWVEVGECLNTIQGIRGDGAIASVVHREG